MHLSETLLLPKTHEAQVRGLHPEEGGTERVHGDGIGPGSGRTAHCLLDIGLRFGFLALGLFSLRLWHRGLWRRASGGYVLFHPLQMFLSYPLHLLV